jgi:hypothetical protein
VSDDFLASRQKQIVTKDRSAANKKSSVDERGFGVNTRSQRGVRYPGSSNEYGNKEGDDAMFVVVGMGNG